MSIPANDAFSVHDSLSRRPRTLTRSPSPKVPFTPSRSPSLSMSMTRPRRTSRHISSSAIFQSSRLTDVQESDHIKSRSRSEDGQAKKEKVDWEIPRKTLHSSIGFLTLHLYVSNSSPKLVVVALYIALAVLVPLDIMRLRSPSFERLYERYVGFLMRESEKKNTNGTIWYIIGVLFVLSVYPLDIAVVSILILSWGDTAASTIGRLWGRYTPPLPRRVPVVGLPFAPRKSLAGFLAASVTGMCVAISFWRWIAQMRNGDYTWRWEDGTISPSFRSRWITDFVKRATTEMGIMPLKMSGWSGLGVIGMVAGVVAGVAEALDVGALDDNLTLPIISGGCLWGFFKFLEFFSE